MITKDLFNIKLIETPEKVDQVNKQFYEKFTYPWLPQAFPSYSDSRYWTCLLNQDIGYYTNDRIPPDAKIWVAGCGTNQAIFTALKYPQAEILATDISTESLKICKKAAEQIGITNLQLEEKSLNHVSDDNQFDYIICTGVIHHNADPAYSLKRLATALNRSGILELMVYNYYHRIVTTAYQKAVRLLCESEKKMDLALEYSMTQKMIDQFPLKNRMGDFLRSLKNMPEAMLADYAMQPVEYSYTVESMKELAEGCNLEILLPCFNQLDMRENRVSWDLEFGDPSLDFRYRALSDPDRWQVSNLLMNEKSPMLWFYFQRNDSIHKRKSEKEICDEFLETKFECIKNSVKLYVNQNGRFILDAKDYPLPAPPVPKNDLAAKVFHSQNSNTTMRNILEKLNMQCTFHTVNTIRINLTTTLFPYLTAIH